MRRPSAATLGVACCVAVAAALTFPRLDCPGLYYDEVFFVDGFTATRCAWCPGGWPVMALSYLGALKTWLYWPLADRLSPALVRGPAVALALVSGIVTVATAGRFFGRRAAVIVAALLFTDPAYLYFQRLDWGPVAIGIFLRAVVLALAMRWFERPSVPVAAAAGLLCGIGVYDKLTFAWFVAGVAVAIAARRRAWRADARAIAVAAAMAVLGAAPLLAYNLAAPLVSVRSNALLAGGDAPEAQWGYRVRLLVDSLNGAVLHRFVSERPLAPPLGGAAAPLVLLAAGVAAAWPRLRRDPRVQVVLGSTVTVVLALLVVANVGPHHVPTLFPQVQLLAGIALAAVAERGRAVGRAIAAVVAAVALLNVAVDVRTLGAFRTLCGKGRWSDAIYAVADFVRAHAGARVVVADWGFACQLRALAPGVAFHDVSWALQEDPGGAWRTVQPGDGRPTYVILHAAAATVMPAARAAFLERAARDGVALDAVARFTDREHVPVAEILRVGAGP